MNPRRILSELDRALVKEAKARESEAAKATGSKTQRRCNK
jgi:hypothetical protein